MIILGISAFYHDSAAALIRDGEIVAAAQEERFTRKKHDSGYPHFAIEYCLREAGCDWRDVDQVVFYDKPFLKFERLLETYFAFAPRGFRNFATAMPVWLKEKLFQKKNLIDQLRKASPDVDWETKLLFSEHHLSHAASAFFPSPFEEAVVLTMDGVGEWTTTSAGIGGGSSLEIKKEIHFPHSLGLLYSAFTYYLGFKVNSGEYKVMGLAPYGQPRFKDLIFEHLIDVKADGSFWLNQDYFDYCTGLKMTNSRFDELFGGPARNPEDPLEQRHKDLAASIQAALDEIVLRITRSLAKETGIKNLCLAGGVALNCVANGKVLRDGAFERVWIQPASGDAGGALGAALAAYYLQLGGKREVDADDSMSGALLGPAHSQNEIEASLTSLGARYDTLSDDELLSQVVSALEEGKAVGWHQGRMEFGPRALGARSILADPRKPDMQKTLNLRIKFRESFRPFAPSVAFEETKNWFDLECESPYMLLVAETKRPSDLPAVTHLDRSARIQTVHRETNPRFHRLLKEFKAKTGCPVLVNTSFNVRGEPIVCTPEDSFRCFMGTDIEVLAIGNCLLRKEEQDPALAKDYKGRFELD